MAVSTKIASRLSTENLDDPPFLFAASQRDATICLIVREASNVVLNSSAQNVIVRSVIHADDNNVYPNS